MVKKPKRSYRKYDSDKDALNYDFSYNDEETSALHKIFNNNPVIDINDLRRIALWKINRVLEISENTIEKLEILSRKETVTVDDDLAKEILGELVASQGVGFPMASAILKFIKPDVFPIIDVRAYRALTGTKPYYSTYTYKKYVDYSQQIRAYAEQLKRPLREIDEQLYCFDQQHNGKI
jgi:thermostable 8-oxoguanine DNA glycosylase